MDFKIDEIIQNLYSNAPNPLNIEVLPDGPTHAFQHEAPSLGSFHFSEEQLPVILNPGTDLDAEHALWTQIQVSSI